MKLSKNDIESIELQTRNWQNEGRTFIVKLIDTIESQQQEIAQKDEVLEQAREALKKINYGPYQMHKSWFEMFRNAIAAIDKAAGEQQ